MINNQKAVAESILTKNGIISLRLDGIITFLPHETIKTITIESMVEDLDAFMKLADGKKLPFLTDNRKLNDFTSDQKKYMQDKIPLFSSKFAVLIDGGLSIFFLNMFQLFYKPEVPMKAFKNKEAALKWLAQND